MKKLFIVLAISGVLSGCASHSHELKAAHVSNAGYKAYTCPELHAELQSSINRAEDLAGVIDKKASDDEAQTAIGMILFWPALFALEGGDGEEAAEYSRLKGEINAIEQTAILKDCDEAVAVAQEYREQERLARVARQNRSKTSSASDY